MSYRLNVEERDLSGFVLSINQQNGAIVVNSHQGPATPLFIEDESAYLQLFGTPDKTKWGGFEAVQYVRQSPAYVVSAIGDNALYAGVDVLDNTLKSFGARTGRDFKTFNNYTTINSDASGTANESSDGKTKVFTSSLLGGTITPASVSVKVGGVEVGTDDGLGGFQPGSILSAGAIDYNTGAVTGLTFSGNLGTVASYISKIDISSPINLNLDGSKGYVDILLGKSRQGTDGIEIDDSTGWAQSIIVANTRIASDPVPGLSNGTQYEFLIDSVEYVISTPTVGVITYTTLVGLIDDAISSDGFTATFDTSSGYIKVVTDATGTAADPTTGIEDGNNVVSVLTIDSTADVNDTTETFTAATHGLTNGLSVTLTLDSGALPTGLAILTTYYVVGATAGTFQLSATLGGAAIDVTVAVGVFNVIVTNPIGGILTEMTDVDVGTPGTTDVTAETAGVEPTSRSETLTIDSVVIGSTFDIVATAGTDKTVNDLVNELNTFFGANGNGAVATFTNADSYVRIISNTLGILSQASITETGLIPNMFAIDTAKATRGNIVGGTNGPEKKVKLTIGGIVYPVNFGNSETKSQAQMISDINAAVSGFNPAAVSTNYLSLTGLVADSTLGGIQISDPDIPTESAIKYIFDAVEVSPIPADVTATSPTESVPKSGKAVTFEYIYTQNLSSQVSHSFFARSPYNDSFFQLGMEVVHLSGSQYQLTLYQKLGVNKYLELTTYIYSLVDEKNGFNQSLYIFDVFKDDPYLIPYVNSDYTNVAAPVTTNPVDLSGGVRGDTPQDSNYVTAWNNFQFINRYPIKTFMDIYGNMATTLETLITTYQPYAFGITTAPIESSVDEAVTYRSGLGIDNDVLALYHNWMKIKDTYNDSTAWVSGIGKVGVKYAEMNAVYDGLPPAGIDENGRGGQLAGFQVLEMADDFTDTDLKKLDEAQINPIIFDPVYGVMTYGNKTMQVSLSDSSYIHTRRVYNWMLDNVTKQVLRRQEFKLNDRFHRSLAKLLTEQLVNPVRNSGIISEVLVVCDQTNNTDEVLNQRRFYLDIIVKATPDSEFITLRLIRISQTQSVTQFLT